MSSTTHLRCLFFGAAQLLAFSLGALAQTGKPLDNAAVLKMKAAGLDDATIVKAIETSPGNYDTSPEGLIALKDGGTGSAVLGAILQSTNRPAPKVTAQGGTGGYPDELGVYYLKQDRYGSVEPEVLNLRTTNALATMYSFGIKKMKVNGWVVGKHSKTRLGSEIKEFFLDIPEGVSPNEYTLLRFVVKGDRREVELARSGLSVTVGTERSAIPFESKKVEKGKYLITVKSLASGEYAFMPPGAQASASASSAGKAYTFQIVE